jgi:hypothetical protein
VKTDPTVVTTLVTATKRLHLRTLDVPFPGLSPTPVKSRFQVKPAVFLTPIEYFASLLLEELYGTRYQSASFFYAGVGSGAVFTACMVFFTASLPKQSN